MIYVGIDVAKETHYAAVMDDDNNVLVKPFDFTNDAVGFAKLISKLSAFPKDNLLIGLESTGIYSENLIAFLYDSGFRIAVINPIQTATLRKTGIRKTKTDKTDTFLIIKSLMILSISVDKNSPRINKCIVVKSANSDIGSIKIALTFHHRRKTADRMAYPPVVPVAHIVDPDYMLKLLDSINLTPAA